ncbi:MAG: ATP-binding protein [Clostridia bacterium]|nr:ATP-binding protein [Clostridia bacterium]
MQVVGITTQQEVWVASKDRRFKINEILVIEDRMQGPQKGEVVETSSYNRYIPLAMNSSMVDDSVIKSLEALGYDIGGDTIHIGKVRLLIEAQYPLETGAKARVPAFGEVKDMLVKVDPDQGLVLGVIKSTEDMAAELEPELRDIAYVFQNGRIDPQEGVPFIFDIQAMNQYPHVGIFGGSGSGKSFALRVILEEIMKLKIPAIVLDPHYEMDFSTEAKVLDDRYLGDFKKRFKCLQIGFHIGINFSELTTGDLKNLLSASGQLSDAMSNAVDVLHKRKDTYQSFSERVELLSEALEEGKQSLMSKLQSLKGPYERGKCEESIKLLGEYGNVVPLQSAKGIAWRLRRLYNDGVFNNDIKPIEEGLKSGQLMVVQGHSRLLQVFATYLLNNLYKKRRNYRDAQYKNMVEEYFPPFIIATDEAHNFAPKAFDSPSKSILKEISQEGRKYGVFLVLATQRPTLLDETITAQLNSKFVFRTVRGSDIATIREETDLTKEEAARLPYLRSGDAFVSSAIMGRTFPIRIRMAKTMSPHTQNPFEELKAHMGKEEEDVYQLVRQYLPVMDSSLLKVSIEISKEKMVSMDFTTLKSKLEYLVEKGKIQKKKTPLGDMYEEIT